jgi:DNA-binding protein H-NS
MPEFMTTLNNRANLRRALRDLHSDEVESIIERLQVILTEKQEAQQAADAERAIKNQAKEEVLALMAEKGLDIADFVAIQPGQVVSKPKKPAGKTFTYRWKEGKETFEYTGLSIGVISSKNKNGERFAKMLKKTKTKRPEYIVGAAA